MVYSLITTKQAKQDLKDIAKYIARENPVRAMTFIDEMESYFKERLSHFPLSTKLITNTIRILPYKRYGALYIVDEREKLVKVLHIFAGGQDWENNI